MGFVNTQETWASDTMKKIYKMMDLMKEKKTSITARAVITHERNWVRPNWGRRMPLKPHTLFPT